MAIDMFLYVPADVDTKADGYQVPNAKNDVPVLIKSINEKPTEETPAEEEEDDGNYRYRRQGPNNDKQLQAAHPEPLWTAVLAWSWGMSHSGTNPNIQDISMTRYSDLNSETYGYYLVKGTKLPHAILRVVGQPKKGKIAVQEFELVNAQFTSISTGGSGGEDRLTENITIQFDEIVASRYEFSMETGDVVKFSSFFWDDKNQKASRSGTTVKVDSLAAIAEAALSGPEGKKEVGEEGSSGRRKKALCVAPLGTGLFKKVYPENPTLESLKAAASKSLGKEVKNAYSVFNKDFSTLLDSDEDVKELASESLIYVD